MRTRNLLLIAVLLLVFGNAFVQGQQTHTITLYVNTAEITRENTNQVCYFIAETSGEDPIQSDGDLENFTIEVNLGDIVIWNGVSTSSEDDVVNIKRIKHQSGPDVFDNPDLPGNGQNREQVQGTVRRGNKGDIEKYKIHFTVFINENPNPGNFKIDPKIKVK